MPFEHLERDNELAWLKESKAFIEKELNVEVEVREEEEVKDEKASKSMPYKPAFVVVQ